MVQVTKQQITEYIEKNIQNFHERRLENLSRLKLMNVLKKKNPYLFKAKNINTAQDLVEGILSAHLSSQEEGIFGNFLEGLAIYVCGIAHNGRKSSAEGIDLEVEIDGVYYIVTIKSGPNWGNSSQINKMKDSFIKATRILRTSGHQINVIAVNGCCYGREGNEDKGGYLKLCGEAFWTFVSGQSSLYLEIVEPLGHQAKERNVSFQLEYEKVLNKFTKEFLDRFCSEDGSIKWEEIVAINSGKALLKVPLQKKEK